MIPNAALFWDHLSPIAADQSTVFLVERGGWVGGWGNLIYFPGEENRWPQAAAAAAITRKEI